MNERKTFWGSSVSRLTQEMRNRPEVARMAATISWAVIEKLRSSLEGYHYLNVLKRHLDQGGCAVVAANHLAVFDIKIIDALKKGLGGSMSQIGFPMSSKFFDDRMGLAGPIGRSLQEVIGVEWYKVAQAGDELFSKAEAKEINAKAALSLQQLLLSDGGVGCIFPEGTRSRSGSMNRAQPMEWLFMDLQRGKMRADITKRVLIVPMAIWGTEKIHRPNSRRLNLFAKIGMKVGEPLTHEQAMRERKALKKMTNHSLGHLGDVAMLHVAELLPSPEDERKPDYRGFYRKYLPILVVIREQLG